MQPSQPPPGGAVPAPGWAAWAPPTTANGAGTVGVGRDDQVSGEAVALDLPGANVGLRILSGLIDFIAAWVVFWGLVLFAIRVLLETFDVALFQTFLVMASVVAFVVIPTTWETLTRGKTLGHYIVGLRTVRDDAGPIQFRHALARALMGTIEIYGASGVPALIVAAANRRGKRVGDLLAGTYVIRDRAPQPLHNVPTMPAELGAWASSADIGAVPAPTANSVRRFLARRENLTPAVREDLAQRLVWFIAPYISPAPPPGSPAESVLTAVMTERRRRASQRLQQDAQLRDRLLS